MARIGVWSLFVAAAQIAYQFIILVFCSLVLGLGIGLGIMSAPSLHFHTGSISYRSYFPPGNYSARAEFPPASPSTPYVSSTDPDRAPKNLSHL